MRTPDPPVDLESRAALSGETPRQAVLAEAPLGVTATAPPPASTLTGTSTLAGVLVDVQGRGLSGVAVGVDGAPRARWDVTESDGSFRLALAGVPARVVIDAPDWLLVSQGLVQSLQRTENLVLVASREAPLEGRTVDEEGDPVGSARVRLSIPAGALANTRRDLGGSESLALETVSDADGAFRFESAPFDLPALQLEARAYAYEDAERRMDGGDPAARLDLELTLVRAEDAVVTLFGTVRDQRAQVVGGATVWADGRRTLSGSGGGYELELSARPSRAEVVATKDGLQAGVATDLMPALLAAQASRADRAGPVDVYLGPPERRIRGRVLSFDGEPLEGWLVNLLDPRVLTDEEYPPLTAERLGQERPFHVTTTAQGEFSIGGLSDRAYRLEARDPATLLRILSGPVQAGDEAVVLRAPENPLYLEVVGTVVDLDGVAIEGVQVSVATYLGAQPDGGGLSIDGQRQRTSAEGSFRFRDVPRAGAHLRLRGAGIVPTHFALDPEADADALVVAVRRRINLRYEHLGSGPIPENVRAESASGELLQMSVVGATGSSTSLYVDVIDGKTPIFAVAEDVASLILIVHNEEVARRPVDPGVDWAGVSVVH
ncbi:MAG: hypothetical protein AAFZ65_02170 [Planctomycetota bacterium]